MTVSPCSFPTLIPAEFLSVELGMSTLSCDLVEQASVGSPAGLRRAVQPMQDYLSKKVMNAKQAHLSQADGSRSGQVNAQQRNALLASRPRSSHQSYLGASLKTYGDQLTWAEQERSQLTLGDHFEAHDLDSRKLKQLQQQLSGYPIEQAYLVKKHLHFFPEQPLYVLMVTPSQAGPQPTLETQIAQELMFQRELLVRLTSEMQPELMQNIRDRAVDNLLTTV